MSQYLLKPEHREVLESLLKKANKYRMDDDRVRLMCTQREPGDLELGDFKAKRRQLLADATEYLRNVELPPRVSLPALANDASHAQILEAVYQNSAGLVIGEAHASSASKRFLIDNFAALKAQGVETLYFEHILMDFSADDLEALNRDGTLRPDLARRLNDLDTNHYVKPGPYTFQQVVVEAERQGLKVVSLDCATAWYAKGVRGGGTDARQRMFSYLASRTIEAHQAADGKHNWVALVGNSHSNQLGSVPGLAELNSAIGIRVAEPEVPGKTRMQVDPGLETSFNRGIVKADYLLEVEVPEPASGTTRRLPIDSAALSSLLGGASINPSTDSSVPKLTHTGSFYFQKGRTGNMELVHLSRDRTLHRTPIIHANGLYSIPDSNWKDMKARTFADLGGLSVALVNRGMSEFNKSLK